MTMCSMSRIVPVRWFAGSASARPMLCGSAVAAIVAPLKTRRKSRRSVVVIVILASPLFGEGGDARSAQLRSCDGFVIDRRRDQYSDRGIDETNRMGPS